MDYQVIIIGGGPVGVGLAIELGQRDISVALIERYPQPQPIPKGQNLTQRTVEHFYFWGIEDDLRAARVMPRDYPNGGVTVYGDLSSEYWFPWFRRSQVQDYYFMANERLPQYATEAVLRQRADALESVETFYGWSATQITQNAGGVSVRMEAVQGEESRTITAAYAVGCDGSHSTTREQAGIGQTRTEYDTLMALLVFRSRELHEYLTRLPEAAFFRILHPDLDGYWRFLGRVDVGEGWFFHAPVPPDSSLDSFDAEAFLSEALGISCSATFDYVGFWDLRVSIATEYRQDRIFIAGDACHSHPPYGGYGVNTGFEDARNLGWKLAAVLQGWGGDGLLDSYTAERLPVFQSTSNAFIEKYIDNTRAFFDTYDLDQDKAAFQGGWDALSKAEGDVQLFRPHYEGSPIVSGGRGRESGAVSAHTFEASPGHHLAPQALTSGENVYEVFGPGFTLLSFAQDADELAPFEQVAARLGIPLKTVVADGQAAERAYGHRLILVRPDQFVAWVGDEPPDDAEAVLRLVIGDATE